MPAKSRQQQKLFGLALSVKRGESPKSKASKQVLDIVDSMSEKEIEKYVSTKHKSISKKIKEEMSYDNQIGATYAVKKADKNCKPDNMVFSFDPVMGISSTGIQPDNVYGLYPDEKTAQIIAEKVYKEYQDSMVKLEEKKGTVTTKLQKAIDKLEKERKEHMQMAKENPKEASTHKSQVDSIEAKIKTLMDKLEKVEKSKKPIEEEPEELKEGFQSDDTDFGDDNLSGFRGDSIDHIKMDVPLFIRLLEFAREDAKSDMDLHKVAEQAIKLSKSIGVLDMSKYGSIIVTTEVGSEEEAKSQAKHDKVQWDKESALEEESAYEFFKKRTELKNDLKKAGYSDKEIKKILEKPKKQGDFGRGGIREMITGANYMVTLEKLKQIQYAFKQYPQILKLIDDLINIIKLTFKQETSDINEIDRNDPILTKVRANNIAIQKHREQSTIQQKRQLIQQKLQNLSKKLYQLEAERDEILADQDYEAGIDGMDNFEKTGMNNVYGDELNAIDAKIEKVQSKIDLIKSQMPS